MVGGGRMEVVTTKGCSKMYADVNCKVGSNSFRDFQPPQVSTSNSPFSGLVICVSGLSKVRLNESLYGVKSVGENHMAKENLNRTGSGNTCHPVAMLENVKQCNLIPKSRLHSLEEQKRRGSIFSGQTFYVDPDVSAELRNKVVKAAIEEGAMCLVNGASQPQWVLKTVKEVRTQRLVHLSADLTRHVGMMLGNVSRDEQNYNKKLGHKENQRIAILAKEGVRNRRGNRMQLAGQTSIKPLVRSILLDSINWTMSEPSSTVSICMDSFSLDDANESINGPDACFVNFLRPLSEREKNELVFGNHFITILFPVDRLGEMGPSSRTFFSDTGFKCTQLLDHIYSFYQESMSTSEIELAIHTDSRHADNIRSMYSSKEAAEYGFLKVKRIDFLGSQRIFKMLKHVPGNSGNNVFELLTRA
ncbi:hypothetical protein L1987_29657 [Smallanthus sonchifolius]|uniref:Uncharacterized protein n=1 Tax=Smallanthus sonchifolius TaxID=185202 RepID=A0ACB9I038_9ASTR|nr:hypothetical protein L1987_29657 [Smallanthus sonchifolius]